MTNSKKELHWFEKLPGEIPEDGKNHVQKETVYRRKDEGGTMSKQVHNLEKYVTEAEHWINQVAAIMESDDRKDRAWNALRGVLHALRDRVPPSEVMQFSAQLPMLLRGLFLEGYQLSKKPDKLNADELVARIEANLGPKVDGKQAFRAVLAVLYDHISEGELHDIYATLPKDIRQLWDQSMTQQTK